MFHTGHDPASSPTHEVDFSHRASRGIVVKLHAGDNGRCYTVIMIRTQISLDRQLYSDARREARRRRVSFAELCRQSLERTVPPVTGEGKTPWMRFAGALEGGGRDASQTVDAVVYGRRRP